MNNMKKSARCIKGKTAAQTARHDDPFYSRKNQARLREAIEQIETGRGTVHELIEIDDK
jgi:hypothetical protein